MRGQQSVKIPSNALSARFSAFDWSMSREYRAKAALPVYSTLRVSANHASPQQHSIMWAFPTYKTGTGVHYPLRKLSS